ncbi:MAG: hypothetical protein JW726_17980 [Anaerolineales bacterium]|nr:hypothetical protein [Anaerolineales bacterium]
MAVAPAMSSQMNTQKLTAAIRRFFRWLTKPQEVKPNTTPEQLKNALQFLAQKGCIVWA